MANVSVIGAGSWGTALALLLCKNGHDVTVWSYKEEEVRTLSEKREHVSKLPGVKIPNEIFFTADLKEAVEGKDVVVLAVPSIHVRNTAKKMNAYVKSGQILVDGKPISGTGTDRGVVFQQYALFPWMTVKKNVMFGLNLKGIKGKEAEDIAMKYIKMVQLEDFVDHYPKELSGGMKQRVAIARAYAVNPSILLMDEPFGALDAQTRTQLQTELLETWEKERKTCFFITHDVDEAIILAQKVIIMSARPGRIKEIVDINIPYPRTQETKMTPEFLELKNHIWSQVYQEYLEVRK